jgi:hypothetical protein
MPYIYKLCPTNDIVGSFQLQLNLKVDQIIYYFSCLFQKKNSDPVNNFGHFVNLASFSSLSLSLSHIFPASFYVLSDIWHFAYFADSG